MLVITAPDTRSTLATATTKASKHQAVTSSTAAQVMATAPTRVPSRRRSLRMRANTGNAVMLMATPRKSVNARNGTFGSDSSG